MKIYQSPLSWSGILLSILGTYLIIVMLNGAWPTIFAFVFLGLGLLMILSDYFIRKSKLKFKTKLIIQTIAVIVPLLLSYLFFSGRL